MLQPLTKIKKKIKKFTIQSFDCETYGQKNKFLFVGILNKKYIKQFTNKNDAIEYINEISHKNSRMYATNLGFDYCALFFPEHITKSKLIMRNGDLILAKYELIKMADTNNYCNPRLSVEKMGKIIGQEKLKHPKALGQYPKNAKEWINMYRYNSQDCRITKMFMEKLQDAFNILGCEMQLTIASTSMNLYRRKYMPIKNIYHEKNYLQLKEFIFDSYYGGRTETFARGKLNDYSDLFYYDFSSLYPSVMTNNFPLPSSCFIIINPLVENIINYYGISRCTVECSYMMYPILPFRDSDSNKLLFPYGTFTGTWTHEELKYAIENGYKILKIHKQIIYRKKFKPFKKYVETLYKLRLKYKKEKNDFMQMTCKLLMNSLYGKMASKSSEDYDIIDGNDKQNYTSKEFDKMIKGYDIKAKIKDAKYIEDFYFIKDDKKDVDKAYIHPILSSYVTSYGRIKLHKELVKHNALYCDTDSIMTYDKFDGSTDLGHLKLEDTIVAGWIVKPKMYYIISKSKYENVKIKGIRGANKNLFLDLLNNKSVKQSKFVKLKESLVRMLSPNEIIDFYKDLSLNDDKRNWNGLSFNKDKFEWSKPLFIEEKQDL